MSLAATIAVDPPTEPAVCTRIMGLPTAPRASARYSSGIATPSNMSGALPSTTASMSDHVMPASSRASCAASRTRPAIDTSLRAVRCTVWPTPTTATRSPAITTAPSDLLRGASSARLFALQDDDHVLLQRRPTTRVRDAAVGCAVRDAAGDLTDTREPSRHHRVRREGTARWVDIGLRGVEP